AYQIHLARMDTCDPAAGPGETLHQTDGDRINPGVKHDGDLRRGSLHRHADSGGDGIDQVDLLPLESLRRLAYRGEIPLHVPDVHVVVHPFVETDLLEADPHPAPRRVVRSAFKHAADAVDLARRLRLGGERRGEEAASQGADERSSVQQALRTGRIRRRMPNPGRYTRGAERAQEREPGG